VWLLGVSGKTKQEVRAKLKALHQELNSGVNLDHFEGLTRCLGALSALALERDAPHLAARLIGTAAAVRDRFGFKPWPYVTQAERPAIQRAAALLPDSEYTAQLAAGRSQAIDDALTAALPILQDRQPAASR
jgi:hypothetical protein